MMILWITFFAVTTTLAPASTPHCTSIPFILDWQTTVSKLLRCIYLFNCRWIHLTQLYHNFIFTISLICIYHEVSRRYNQSFFDLFSWLIELISLFPSSISIVRCLWICNCIRKNFIMNGCWGGVKFQLVIFIST